MTTLSRRAVLATVGAGLAGLAGCSTGSVGSGSEPTNRGGTEPSAGAMSEGSTTASGSATPSAASASEAGLPTADEQLPMMHSTDALRGAVRDGGPPKDGIPSIDDPSFWSAAEADRALESDDIVFGVVGDGTAKAYPQHVLVYHEICNDVLDDRPVSVTYCPLTGTVLGFDRGETTFGVSGDLVNSNLVLYDRATDSRWPQVLATAISGPLEDSSLTGFPLVWTTWAAWHDAHPETLVLSEDTGYVRNYGSDPYGSYTPRRGYYARGPPMFAPLARDDRFDDKDVVVGTRDAGVHAVSWAHLLDVGLVSGGEMLAVHDDTIDAAYVYHNPGGTSFEAVETGGGRLRIAGPDGEYTPDALPLDRLDAFTAMWFAWYGFYPETEVHTA